MSDYFAYELHCHTNHSDGEMTPKELVTNAKNKGYKGIAITDHNTVSAVEEVVYFGQKIGLDILKGIEWTTFYGHITAIEGDNDIDWRDINPSNIDEIIEKANKKGVLLAIAHPKRYGSPICTGCYLDLPITKYEYIHAMEVWTQKDPHLAECNKKALEFYDSLLRKGYRIAAVYGYDWHREDKKKRPYAMTFIGNGREVMQSIKKGDTFVSLGLEIEVRIDNKKMPLSSELIEGSYVFDIKVKQYNKTFCEMYAIKPQKVVFKGSSLNKDIQIEINKPFKLDLKKGYLRIEIKAIVEGKEDCIVLITSPYYIV